MLMGEVDMSRQSSAGSMVIYAPNVHVGGGFVLLVSLLNRWSSVGRTILLAFLDQRIKNKIQVPSGVEVYWVRPTIRGRMLAQLELRKRSFKAEKILCFHGIPPIFPVHSEVIVFLQNKLHFQDLGKEGYKLKVRLRIWVEKLLFRFFSGRVDRYIVQTPSMRDEIINWCLRRGVTSKVLVCPFVDVERIFGSKVSCCKQWDYLYVADGLPHKNHDKLFDAWKILAKDGLFPILALTLDETDFKMMQEIERTNKGFNVKIINLGRLAYEEMGQVYRSSSALIYPSLAESFGLPLLEAKANGLSIVASELDYVRDVCKPVETFDPNSAMSIARAVKRHLGAGSDLVEPKDASDFWLTVVDDIGGFKYEVQQR